MENAEMRDLFKNGGAHGVTWTVSGAQTWAVEAFPLSLLYPNWAIDLKANYLAPAWGWFKDTGTYEFVTTYVEALVQVTTDVFSSTA